ncbi:hypothetical protein QYE76_042177 [Lolium multiflorum]|uniref:Uncharacterized protein n=1 Tax=Lolium multiflorum TaxID=4521 RepID=A0AAD8TGF6_LOLMU|nr:hypothetical protein QYE76_042177 [Lolium multiflorum]
MDAASSPVFLTQEEVRVTKAVASRGGFDDQNDGTQDTDEEDEHADLNQEIDKEDALEPMTASSKGRKRRKKNSSPVEPRIKWTGKEEECLTEAWKTVSMNDITGANKNFEMYWQRVKLGFDERKIVDPYFNKTVMIHGDKAMGPHWGIMQAVCSKWHCIHEEIDERPVSGADFEAKTRRAFDWYTDDNDGQTFKYLNVFARTEKCEKWKEVRKNLVNKKGEKYNPDDPAHAASAGRPELGQKKLKELKKAGHPAKRLQASFDKCWADARAHADGRDDKHDVRWKEMLAN